MTPTTIFAIIVSIILLNYFLNRWLGWLNDRNFSELLPPELQGIYDEEEYKKSRAYDKETSRFSILSSTFSLLLMLAMLFFDGFAFVDQLVRKFTTHSILLPLIFFAVLSVASGVLTAPFSWYHTFVIEERFGFNKITIKTYLLDKLKGMFLAVILGGGMLSLFVWFYHSTGTYFWLWAWALFSFFMVLITMFYATLIVPLFNKLTPLEEGSLRDEITSYCDRVGYQLDNLFVMDGSKRSSKANAFFSGLGPKKRIVLYDTLVNEYSKEEITAVLAHEIGHYKNNHTLKSVLVSIAQMGLMLFVLSLVINRPEFSVALGVSEKTFHIGLLVFSILYTPLSLCLGVTMNVVSRKNEYEADNYAKITYSGEHLVSSLKKLSVDSLSNLTPHPYYVFFNYSHPTLLQRISALGI